MMLTVRYSAMLNTGEVLVDSIEVRNNVDIMRAIVKDINARVKNLRIGQARDNKELARKIDIRYRLHDSQNKLSSKEVVGPYTICI